MSGSPWTRRGLGAGGGQSITLTPLPGVGLGLAFRHTSDWDAAAGRSQRLETPVALEHQGLRLEVGPVLGAPADAAVRTPGIVSRLSLSLDSVALGVSLVELPAGGERLRELNLRLRF